MFVVLWTINLWTKLISGNAFEDYINLQTMLAITFKTFDFIWVRNLWTISSGKDRFERNTVTMLHCKTLNWRSFFRWCSLDLLRFLLHSKVFVSRELIKLKQHYHAILFQSFVGFFFFFKESFVGCHLINV